MSTHNAQTAFGPPSRTEERETGEVREGKRGGRGGKMRREKEREENERRGRKKTREEIDFGEATRLGRIERVSDIVRNDGLDTG